MSWDLGLCLRMLTFVCFAMTQKCSKKKKTWLLKAKESENLGGEVIFELDAERYVDIK